MPDSAHGTNPATAAMAGFEVVSVPSDANGNTDVEFLAANLDETVAAMMYTLPTTLGLFDPNIGRIAADAARARGAALRRRREPERLPRPGALRRHGLRRRAPEPAQDVLDAARRRRPGRGAGLREVAPRAVPAGAGRRQRDGDGLPLRAAAEEHRQDDGVPRQLRRAAARAHLHQVDRRRGPARDQRERGDQRQLRAGAAARRATSSPSTGAACTRWCSPARGRSSAA